MQISHSNRQDDHSLLSIPSRLNSASIFMSEATSHRLQRTEYIRKKSTSNNALGPRLEIGSTVCGGQPDTSNTVA